VFGIVLDEDNDYFFSNDERAYATQVATWEVEPDAKASASQVRDVEDSQVGDSQVADYQVEDSQLMD
jgi:hypothetical protein